MKKILVVDDHKMFRQALVSLLTEGMTLDNVFCSDASNAKSTLEKLSEEQYDLVILDVAMPESSGLDLLPELKRLYPEMPVLVLSMFSEEQFALQALRQGASGYITKHEAADELLTAIDMILSGGRYLSKSFYSALLEKIPEKDSSEEPLHKKLSRRELEIMKMIAAGNNLTAISKMLGLSIKTVSTYKTRLCIKMGFKSNPEIIAYAISFGLA